MTLLTVTRRVLRAELAGTRGLAGFVTGTATNTVDNAGSPIVQAADTLVDGSVQGLQDLAYDATRFAQATIYLPDADEEHRVYQYSPDAGSIQVGRNFATIPVTGTTVYELHTHGLAARALNDCLDWACQNARYPDYYLLPGLVPDGDLELPDTSAWLPGTGCTVTKPVVNGKRVLLQATTVAGAYVATSAMATRPKRLLRIYVECTPAVGVNSIVVWDRTNNAALPVQWQFQLDTADPAVSTGKCILSGSFTTPYTDPPASTASIELRLTNDNVAGSATWHAVTLYDVGARWMTLPDWITPASDHIAQVLQRIRIGLGPDDYVLETIPGVRRPEADRIALCAGDLYGPVMLLVSRPFPTLPTDADTVPDWARRWLVAGALKAAYTLPSRPSTMESSTFRQALAEAEADWVKFSAANNTILRYGRVVWSKA